MLQAGSGCGCGHDTRVSACTNGATPNRNPACALRSGITPSCGPMYFVCAADATAPPQRTPTRAAVMSAARITRDTAPSFIVRSNLLRARCLFKIVFGEERSEAKSESGRASSGARPLPMKRAVGATASVFPFPLEPARDAEPARPRVSFIIPAHNEAQTIAELELDSQIVVVDDGSTDATPAILERWAKTHPSGVVVTQSNRGKGAAIRAAIPHVDRDIVVIQDADMEYDPAEVPALIEPIARGAADVVFGSRLAGGKPQRAYMFWHLVGNKVLSLLTNVLYNTTLSDMETGYKAFRVEVLRSLDLRQDDFAIEPEITAKVCKRRLRVYELPIAYYGRTYAEGKKITWRDGFKAIRVLLGVRLFG